MHKLHLQLFNETKCINGYNPLECAKAKYSHRQLNLAYNMHVCSVSVWGGVPPSLLPSSEYKVGLIQSLKQVSYH